MDLKIIIEQLTVLFFIMAIGFLINKLGILNKEYNKCISKLLLTIGIPGLLISSVANGNPFESNYDIFNVLYVCTIIHIFVIILALVVTKLFRFGNTASVYRFMYVFPNAGFIGFPVINAIFGPEALIYATVFQLPSNILCYTYGIYLMSGMGFNKNEALKSILNPCIVAALIACSLCILDIHLPSLIIECGSYLGSITTPLGMVIIGSSLASCEIDVRKIDVRLYINILIKMFLLPILCYLFLSLICNDAILIAVLTITFGLPAATNTVVFANLYNKDIELASEVVFITTVMCLFSIPIICSLLLI